MSIVEDDHDDEDILDESDEEAVEELEALGYGPQEGQIVRSEAQPVQSISRNKKIDKILENPDVSEVHVSYKKSGLTGRRQPYVCILFRNGSSIERPLADLGSNEQPHCGPIPEGQIEPQSHYRKPRLVTGGRMRRGGGIGDWFRRTSGNFSRSEVQRFTDENGCTVVFKKLVMRKCKDRHEHDDDDGGHYHNHDHNDCGCGHKRKHRGFFS